MSSSPISLRIDERGRARLAAYAELRRESQHTLALRLLEEGLRMLDHPGIIFRDGPAGRRAGLIAGPDVWEVIGGIRGASGDAELDEAAADLGLARAQVDVAVRYYGEFAAEIDDRIQRNSEDADRRRALFQQGADALA
jgi:hypothetical protein